MYKCLTPSETCTGLPGLLRNEGYRTIFTGHVTQVIIARYEGTQDFLRSGFLVSKVLPDALLSWMMHALEIQRHLLLLTELQDYGDFPILITPFVQRGDWEDRTSINVSFVLTNC